MLQASHCSSSSNWLTIWLQQKYIGIFSAKEDFIPFWKKQINLYDTCKSVLRLSSLKTLKCVIMSSHLDRAPDFTILINKVGARVVASQMAGEGRHPEFGAASTCLSRSFRDTSEILPRSFQDTSVIPQDPSKILPRYFWDPSKILPRYFQDTSKILPRYFQDTPRSF